MSALRMDFLVCVYISSWISVGGFVFVGHEPAPANPLTNKRVDWTIRGLLANGGVLYGDTVVTTTTCKSHADNAAIVDGSAAAKAAAGKVCVSTYHLISAPARCGPLAAVGAITRPPSQPQTASERS